MYARACSCITIISCHFELLSDEIAKLSFTFSIVMRQIVIHYETFTCCSTELTVLYRPLS